MTTENAPPKVTTYIRQLCAAKGVTMYQLANRLGISPSTINMYGRNERYPSPEIAAAICRELNCEIGDLLKLP